MISDKFQRSIALFDAANAQDPTVTSGVPEALLYSQRMTSWLERLYPEASEELKLAARSQHLKRWMIPRSNYPMTRAGYHQWRTALYGFHAQEAGKILEQVGYESAIIDRVKSLLKKQNLKIDPQTQTLEDVACLVFMENYLSDFAPRQEEGKMVTILKRTWAKMSEKGREAALGLELPENVRAMVRKALNSGE